MIESHVVTYRGAPAFARMLAQMLMEEGLEVDWESPVEGRNLEGAIEAYTVDMTVAGSLFAIKLAVDKFRRRAGQTEVKIDGEDDTPTP